MKSTMGTALLLVLLAVTAALSGCSSGDVRSADLQATWSLESLGGITELIPADPSVTTEITFAAGKVSGNGGVNSFSGTYEADDDGRLVFDPIIATKMAGTPAANDQETAFLDVLEKTRRFEFDSGKLILMSSDNDSLAILVAK